jgi:hypothetical protein
MSTIPFNERGIGRFQWSAGRVGPIVELLPDGVNVAVVEAFTYVASSGIHYTVPVGQLSDGASIPRALWSVIGSPLTGRYRNIALVHDYLYRMQITSKDEADDVLLDGMRLGGCTETEYLAIYEGVHAGGQIAWNEDKNENKTTS